MQLGQQNHFQEHFQVQVKQLTFHVGVGHGYHGIVERFHRRCRLDCLGQGVLNVIGEGRLVGRGECPAFNLSPTNDAHMSHGLSISQ